MTPKPTGMFMRVEDIERQSVDDYAATLLKVVECEFNDWYVGKSVFISGYPFQCRADGESYFFIQPSQIFAYLPDES